MADKAKGETLKDVRGLLEKLAPLEQVNGVQDYLLADCGGRILARKPASLWEEQVATACAREITKAGEILSLLSGRDQHERVFDFRFKDALIIGWDWGSAYLIAFCSDEVSLPMARMTANVIKEEFRKDKRFRSYLAPRNGSGCDPLTEQELEGELSKHLAALKRK